jgi:hypothetical protein
VSGMPSALTPDSSTRASRSRFPPVCGANLANGTELEERLQSESDAIDRRRRRLVPAHRLGPSSKPHDDDRSKVDLDPQPTLSSRMSVSLGRPGQSRVWTIPLKDAATVNIPRCRAA